MKVKTIFLSVLFSILFAIPVYAGGPIIPGISMGEIHLGITPCKIFDSVELNFNIANYTCKDDLVETVQTNTGGTVWVETETIPPLQVGITTMPRIIREYGNNFKSKFDERYSMSVAYWITYPSKGIAFRMIYTDIYDTDLTSERSSIQSIKIFIPSE